MNALLLLGALLAALALGLALRGLLRALAGLARRRRSRRAFAGGGDGVWTGAAAREAYVPGSIRRSLLGALAALLLLGLPGVALAAAGLSLERDFVRLDEQRWVPVADIGVLEVQGGMLVDVVEPASNLTSPPLAGRLVVAHGEFIRFESRLRALGLGEHQRLLRLAAHASREDVYIGRATGVWELRPPSLLWRLATRLEGSEWVDARQHFSPPIESGRGRQTLLAGSDGYSLSRTPPVQGGSGVAGPGQ